MFWLWDREESHNPFFFFSSFVFLHALCPYKEHLSYELLFDNNSAWTQKVSVFIANAERSKLHTVTKKLPAETVQQVFHKNIREKQWRSTANTGDNGSLIGNGAHEWWQDLEPYGALCCDALKWTMQRAAGNHQQGNLDSLPPKHAQLNHTPGRRGAEK